MDNDDQDFDEFSAGESYEPVEIPPESAMDSESDGGMVGGWEVDGDSNSDYVMHDQHESESEDVLDIPQGKGKAKANTKASMKPKAQVISNILVLYFAK